MVSLRTTTWSAESTRFDPRELRKAANKAPEYEGTLNLAQVLHELQEMLPADAVLTTDAGNFATWPTRFMNRVRRTFSSSPSSTNPGSSPPTRPPTARWWTRCATT